MKKILTILILCMLTLPIHTLYAQANNSNKIKHDETRYTETIVPIYAVCNYNTHEKIYGTVRFDGRVVSSSGRTIHSGNTPIYAYNYVDEYGNRYEPYFSGYTYAGEDSTFVSGCPLN